MTEKRARDRVTEDHGPAATDKKEPEQPIEHLLASANVEKGANVAKKCFVCHDFAKGGPNKVGPNLWGVLERDKGAVANFTYSTSFKKIMQGHWNLEDEQVLLNPRHGPRHFMAFIGLYGRASGPTSCLSHSLSDKPKPLPKGQ